MFNYYDDQNHSEMFVQFLNELIAEHYRALYRRRKWCPVDENVLGMNAVLGAVLFACAGKYPYPEKEIMQCSMEAQRQLPPARAIYDEWIKKPFEGVVSVYCDAIDKIVDENASKTHSNEYYITCPIAPRMAEIAERLHHDIAACNKAKSRKKRIAY